MKFFTNKHVIASLIIAPILAILAWFLVDDWVADDALKAEKGIPYPLVAKSNCRWPSGYCYFENEDVEIKITTDTQNFGQNKLMVRSEIPMTNINFALVTNPDEMSNQMAMRPIDNTYQQWESDVINIMDQMYLQFLFVINESKFHGQAPTTFIYKEPVYN
jgi:hypothetical protein